MKLILLILLFIGNSNIEFNTPYKQLTWKDFKIISSNSDVAAESVTSIGYEYDGYSKVKVSCDFIKDESFAKKSEMTGYILKHEQKHFDITYIFATKFTKLLKQQTELSQEIVDDIYNKIIIEKDRFQESYDRETQHSKNRVMQALWNVKIETLLNNL